MKNHYVMDANSKMVFRGTREECVAFCKRDNSARIGYGMKPLTYRVFHDSATEPCETITT